MNEEEFFTIFINNLESKIDNDQFIAKLGDLITSGKCTEANYRKIIEEEF